jgi:hypothetical protein
VRDTSTSSFHCEDLSISCHRRYSSLEMPSRLTGTSTNLITHLSTASYVRFLITGCSSASCEKVICQFVAALTGFCCSGIHLPRTQPITVKLGERKRDENSLPNRISGPQHANRKVAVASIILNRRGNQNTIDRPNNPIRKYLGICNRLHFHSTSHCRSTGAGTAQAWSSLTSSDIKL